MEMINTLNYPRSSSNGPLGFFLGRGLLKTWPSPVCDKLPDSSVVGSVNTLEACYKSGGGSGGQEQCPEVSL